MHLKISHGHEEDLHLYYVRLCNIYSQKIFRVCCRSVENNNKMNKINAQNGRFKFLFLSGPFDFIVVSGPKLTSMSSIEVGRCSKVVFRYVFY